MPLNYLFSQKRHFTMWINYVPQNTIQINVETLQCIQANHKIYEVDMTVSAKIQKKIWMDVVW